ncbi:MAG: family 78 glycoside hydrolase catalytic domain, partial [Clostridia bacterium]|nr:family 78 glycoside hydrolase catalytic domain [Clostridia bacterium]
MNFIQSPVDTGEAAVLFQKEIRWAQTPQRVEAKATAIGVYNLLINGQKVGEQVLTPGWTSYTHRLLVQTYDITDHFAQGGVAALEAGQGWAVGHIGYGNENHKYADQVACAAKITAYFADGSAQTVTTDGDWDCYTHPVRFTEIYHGELWDGTHQPTLLGKAVVSEKAWNTVPQDGEWIMPQERIRAVSMFIAPNGEKIVDFGQNITGWVELQVQGERGQVIAFDHGEVLDNEGNFYNANYRKAKALAKFILSGEEEVLAPHFTYYGFRYIRLLECPAEIGPEAFTAVVVHSDMKRTGDFECGHPLLNQLYQNIIWGQKGNYLDLPTDCPQRDERLGWTGDTQVFC